MDRTKKPPRRAGRARKPFRWSELPWAEIGGVVLIVAACGALLYSQLDIRAVQAQAARLPAPMAFALLLVLPLIGFPASVLHVAAGIRFGAALGLALVALSIAVQITVSYAIVQRWRPRFERARWLARLRKRIPTGAHRSVTVFTVLLPGAPYSAINYSLPLLGVPLSTLLLCGLPIHTLRSTVTVVFGDQIGQLTATRLSILLVYALLILGTSWWTYRRMQSQFEDPPPMAGDRKQRA